MTRSSSSLNSWPTSSSASSTFGETTFGSARTDVPQRVAVGVDHDDDAELAQLADQVARRRRCRRSRGSDPAKTHDRRAAARGTGACRRNSSTSCAETAGPRSLISVCSPLVGSSTAVFVRDSSRMRTKSLRIDTSRELLDDPRAGRAAAKPGRDDRRAERLEHARDVDALAARQRRLLDRAVAATEPEVRHRERLVDRRVEGDRDDHAARASSRPVVGPVRASLACRRARSTVALSTAEREHDPDRRREPGLGALRRAGVRHLAVPTSGTRATGGRPGAPRRRRPGCRTGAGRRPRPGTSIGRPSRRRAGRAGARALAVRADHELERRAARGSGSARARRRACPGARR